MKRAVICPDEDVYGTAASLSRKIGADALFMYKMTLKHPADLSMYSRVFLGINMQWGESSKNVKRFIYVNRDSLKDAPVVLFCPGFSPKNAEYAEEMADIIRRFSDKLPEGRRTIGVLRNTDLKMAGPLSQLSGLEICDIRTDVLDLDRTSLLVVFFRNSSLMPITPLILLQLLPLS
jgi:hypothetical protein